MDPKRKLLSEALRAARLFKRHGADVPLTILLVRDDDMVCRLELSPAWSKDQVSEVFRAVSRQPGVRATVLFSMAWMATVPRERMAASLAPGAPRPADMPNREEVFVAHLLGHDLAETRLYPVREGRRIAPGFVPTVAHGRFVHPAQTAMAH